MDIKKIKLFFHQLCAGETDISWNIGCCLPVLLWNYICIYILPCISTIIPCLRKNSNNTVGTTDIEKGNTELYTDNVFPPQTNWKRITDIINEQNKSLIGQPLLENCDASDVAQGNLGDCWLLAAFANFTEFPNELKKIFITRCFTAGTVQSDML